LNLVGVDPDISHFAGLWTMWLIPGLWPILQFECFKRYLIAQSITWPATTAAFCVAVLHVPFSWLFVCYLDFGFLGAPMMISISNWLLLIFTLIFTHIDNKFFPFPMELILDSTSSSGSSTTDSSGDGEVTIELECLRRQSVHALPVFVEVDPNDTWPTPSREIFRGWVGFLRIGIPASVSQFMEWGSWEVNAFFIANFGSNPLAAHAIVANMGGLYYTPAIGLASGVTTLIGNALGSGDADNARAMARLGLLIAFLFSVINGGLGVLYRNWVGPVFSHDSDVCSLVAGLMFILWPYHIADLQKCICTGILRACGKPKVSMVGNMVATIFIGYPLAYLFGWTFDLKMTGVWISMTVAWFTSSLIFLIYIFRIDWEREASLSMERIKESQRNQQRMSRATEEFIDSSEFDTPIPSRWKQYLLENC